MLARVGVVAYNAYREAVRARILHGLFGIALATAGYALVVGAYASQSQMRVVSDLGAASISLYSVMVAIVLGATSLYRELEQKTIFPVLARPIRRSEYLVGKLLGSVLTLGVFIAANAGVLLFSIAVLAGRSVALVAGLALGSILVTVLVAVRFRRLRTLLPIPWAVVFVVAGFLLSAPAPADRSVIAASALLTLCEVTVVASIATFFAAFSSPFLTAMFTLGVFVIGRVADSLVKLPAKVFGEAIHVAGSWLAKVVPNLMLYVPARPLLTGEAAASDLGQYLVMAAGHALGWTVLLVALASIVFQRRDFL
ncbi:MAG TPA: ABC transporter permease subunit [Polyangiaceae bacterium]|nr:ABC transporter permease subunit [Polyangiaceae bacterium]